MVPVILEDDAETDAEASLTGWTPGCREVQAAQGDVEPTRLCPHCLAVPHLAAGGLMTTFRRAIRCLQVILLAPVRRPSPRLINLPVLMRVTTWQIPLLCSQL